MNSVAYSTILCVVALSISFFLSGFETGVFSLNRLRIRQLMREGNTAARRLHGYLERSENFLWTIFVGNTLANFVAVMLFVSSLRGLLAGRPWLFWAAFLAGAVALYVGGELLPKTLFRKFPTRLCLRLVGPFRWVHLVLSPLVSVVEHFARLLLRWSGGAAYTGSLFANREEFRELIRERSEALTGTERRLINRVLDLQNVTVAHVARPLAAATSVDVDTPVREILRRCQETHLTRLPVWSGTGRLRRIVGIVSLKTILYTEDLPPRACARDVLRPTLFLDEATRLEDALRRLQRSGHHFAIVLGPDRKEHSLVTLWDILRTVFGDSNAPGSATGKEGGI